MSSMDDREAEMTQLYYEARLLRYAERVGSLKSKLYDIARWAEINVKNTKGKEKAQWQQIYNLCLEGLTHD